MRRILVTGAGGYIGSVLVPKLLKNGFQVLALDRFFFGFDKLSPHTDLKIIQEDGRLFDASLLNGVFAVIDLVAISNDPSGDFFDHATWEINFEARVRTANLAKQAGVQRYILPSSCSIYGFAEGICDENTQTNPLTTYAKANLKAEEAILPLQHKDFTVTVLRQATIFGLSPRTRLDLAINNMVYEAWHKKKLLLMRDGTQHRPMLHVQDTTDIMIQLLNIEKEKINGEIINLGLGNFQLLELAQSLCDIFKREIDISIDIEWYGDPDIRSYQVDFSKMHRLGFQCEYTIERGVKEILGALKNGELLKDSTSITLQRYQELEHWNRVISSLKMHGGMLTLTPFQTNCDKRVDAGAV